MDGPMESLILQSTGASSIESQDELQSLWSGYGSIVRYALQGTDRETVIVKHVCPPKIENHPRGWNTSTSHERKLRSYVVELCWYRQFAQNCMTHCRVADLLGFVQNGDEFALVLEDLDASGYPQRLASVDDSELFSCVDWLANFHATFLDISAAGLWPTGTYWHLDTRPDELEVLRKSDPELAAAAKHIDALLNQTNYKTIIHGDAKLANFCFSQASNEVAAVDFQYVGGGCGMKDLAYFVGSCLCEADCESKESQILDHYFATLRAALNREQKLVSADGIEADWRALYPVAWTDFNRFLKGWSPGHWKLNSYSQRIENEVLGRLKIES